MPDYPADQGWEITYTLIGSSENQTFTSTPDGPDHLVSLASSDTTNWPAGDYHWVAQIGDGTDRYTLGEGRITIKADPASITAGTDLRSHAEKMLEAIESVIEGRASQAAEEMSFEGRSIKFIPITELVPLRDRYRRMVEQERIAAGLAPSTKRVLVRF